MDNLDRIRKEIVASGSITADDCIALRDIVYSDGKVGQEEAEFLFRLRKELGDFGNLKEWDEFFIKAISDYVLDDERSPEAVDDIEASWLIEQIGEDGVIDEVEQKLLKTLRSRAKLFPDNLKEIQKHTSVAKDLGRKIFLLLCGNSKTMRSLQYGVSRTGERKKSVYHIRTNTKAEGDSHDR